MTNSKAETKTTNNIDVEARKIEKETFDALKNEPTISHKFAKLGYKDAYEFVEGAINGVDFRFARGEKVDIPKSIYELLEETGTI